MVYHLKYPSEGGLPEEAIGESGEEVVGKGREYQGWM